jgi:hypothetical protein
MMSLYTHTHSVPFKYVQIHRFVTLAVDFEMSVSCARRLSDFCGVCSNLALISSSFPSVSTRRF